MNNHWIVYHCQEKMEHEYSSLGESVVYSKKEHKELCFNDVIWVVEGDYSSPRTFTLVDCFKYLDTDYPPFYSRYSDFKMKIMGESLLPKRIQLTGVEDVWYKDLHNKFLTKQRFFSSLRSNLEISTGLMDLSKAMLV